MIHMETILVTVMMVILVTVVTLFIFIVFRDNIRDTILFIFRTVGGVTPLQRQCVRDSYSILRDLRTYLYNPDWYTKEDVFTLERRCNDYLLDYQVIFSDIYAIVMRDLGCKITKHDEYSYFVERVRRIKSDYVREQSKQCLLEISRLHERKDFANETDREEVALRIIMSHLSR